MGQWFARRHLQAFLLLQLLHVRRAEILCKNPHPFTVAAPAQSLELIPDCNQYTLSWSTQFAIEYYALVASCTNSSGIMVVANHYTASKTSFSGIPIPHSARPILGQVCTYSGCVNEYDEPDPYHYFINATCTDLETTATATPALTTTATTTALNPSATTEHIDTTSPDATDIIDVTNATTNSTTLISTTSPDATDVNATTDVTTDATTNATDVTDTTDVVTNATSATDITDVIGNLVTETGITLVAVLAPLVTTTFSVAILILLVLTIRYYCLKKQKVIERKRTGLALSVLETQPQVGDDLLDDMDFFLTKQSRSSSWASIHTHLEYLRQSATDPTKVCIPDSAFFDYSTEFNGHEYIFGMSSSETSHLDSRSCACDAAEKGPTTSTVTGGGDGGPGKDLICTTLNCEECGCCQLQCDCDSTEVEDTNSYFICTEFAAGLENNGLEEKIPTYLGGSKTLCDASQGTDSGFCSIKGSSSAMLDEPAS